MSIAPLKKKTVKPNTESTGSDNSTEILAEKFINNGGSGNDQEKPTSKQEDHRLTLRIPKLLVDKIDAKRTERTGNISRNQLILEVLDKALKK